MNRLLLALLLALAAVILPWQARPSAAATLNLGNVISAMNTTQKVASAFPTPISGVSTVDVSQVATPSDPCNIFSPGDPCRLPSYYLAVNRDAASILALRTALGETSIPGDPCTPNGDILCTTIAQVLASQNVSTDTVVGASLTNGALTVFYDSNPAECVIQPGDPCTPPSPI
jgi:hypothetical protein